jgi:hypothetical protein
MDNFDLLHFAEDLLKTMPVNRMAWNDLECTNYLLQVTAVASVAIAKELRIFNEWLKENYNG